MRLNKHSAALFYRNLNRQPMFSVPALLSKLSHEVHITVLFCHDRVVLCISLTVTAVVETSVHELSDPRTAFAREGLFGHLFCR